MNEPLPGMPEPAARTPRTLPPQVRLTRVRNGRLCTRCCRLIHELGVAVAPYPRPSRWRLSSPDGTEYLCEAHKEEAL